jgi:murein DD-endopeptidase MepM/ murein hydrolase activator NlpD
MNERPDLSGLFFDCYLGVNSMPAKVGLILYTLLFANQTLAYCVDNWACYEIVKKGNNTQFWLSNQKAYPITSTLDVNSDNLTNEKGDRGRFSQTRVLDGFERIMVLNLAPIDNGRNSAYREAFSWTPGNMNAVHDDSYRYQLPFSPQSYYPVVQGFGGGYSHTGASKYAIDFAMPEGTAVHAAREGIVIDLAQDHNRGGPTRRFAKYANFVTLMHSDGTTGEYYHLQLNGVVVSLGENVKVGQLIGYSGSTGFSSLPHLHFAVYRAKSHGKYESLPIKFAQAIRQPRW